MTPAFVLHSRPFRETSLLLDLLTLQEGRVSVIARGAKRPKSPLKSSLQFFTPLIVDYFGKTELHTLKLAELEGTTINLTGDRLFSAFYLNELLSRLLHKHEPCPEIFTLYHKTLIELSGNASLEIVLRRFEKHLLEELGYALNLKSEADTHADLNPDTYYAFQNHHGFIASSIENKDAFLGEHILNLAQDNFSSPETLQCAKCIMRCAIQEMLGDKPLKSRELFAYLI